MELSLKRPINLYAFDVDYMGIVHNFVYLRWMEEIRSDMLEPYYSMADAIETGISPIILNTHLHYQMPLRMGDEAFIEIRISDMGKAKWAVEFEVTSDKGIHLKAEQDGMFYDSNNQRPTRIPKLIRDLYEKALKN